MLDFLFRRGNPTNRWRRSFDLTLTAELHAPSLNGVSLGSRFEDLSFLGRNDNAECETLCYFDLGIGLDYAPDGIFNGYMIVLRDEENHFQPYRGTLLWKSNELNERQLTGHSLLDIFGDWYWFDSDTDESIAFYECREHEMQIEIAPSGAIKRFILTKSPLMADLNQRIAYNVERPWPPEYGT